MTTNGMLPHLARAAREAREEAGRLQVHIAATISVNQSTIGKFESGSRWPQDPDRIINAYAEDLEIAPSAIWERALALWLRE